VWNQSAKTSRKYLSNADEKEAENRLGRPACLGDEKLMEKKQSRSRRDIAEAVTETCSVSRELKGKGRKQASAKEVQ
jgi:hypothetical protein